MTIVTPTIKSTVVGYPFKIAVGAKAAKDDVLTFGDPGVIPFNIMVENNATGVATNEYAYNYAEVKITTTYDTDDTSLVYDGGTANQRGNGGWFGRNRRTQEVIYVKADSGYTSTTGTLTVVRGALGTTAVAMADEDYISILNTLVLTGSATGNAYVTYVTMPDCEVKATFF